MWVYQSPSNLPPAGGPAPQPAGQAGAQQASSRPAAAAETAATAEKPPLPAAPAARSGQAAPAAAPRQPRAKRGGSLTAACLALAGAYLFGALLSGVMLAFSQQQPGTMALASAYLGHWARLFDLEQPGAVWGLFAAEYLTAAFGATILLLLGLSAFGPVLIYLFAMLFGLGVGAVGLQLYLQSGWRNALAGAALSGLPTAAAVTGLCLFGASALAVSSSLHRAAFARQTPAPIPAARTLLAQYAVLNVLFLPICGVSTALACLAGQVGVI